MFETNTCMNKIKRQEKKGDSYQSQWEVNIEHIMAKHKGWYMTKWELYNMTTQSIHIIAYKDRVELSEKFRNILWLITTEKGFACPYVYMQQLFFVHRLV